MILAWGTNLRTKNSLLRLKKDEARKTKRNRRGQRYTTSCLQHTSSQLHQTHSKVNEIDLHGFRTFNVPPNHHCYRPEPQWNSQLHQTHSKVNWLAWVLHLQHPAKSPLPQTRAPSQPVRTSSPSHLQTWIWQHHGPWSLPGRELDIITCAFEVCHMGVRSVSNEQTRRLEDVQHKYFKEASLTSAWQYCDITVILRFCWN